MRLPSATQGKAALTSPVSCSVLEYILCANVSTCTYSFGVAILAAGNVARALVVKKILYTNNCLVSFCLLSFIFLMIHTSSHVNFGALVGEG